MSNTWTMFDDFEYRGQWYLPENSERKVSGTVRFDSTRGITLELTRALRESPGTSLDEVYKPKLILGEPYDGPRRMTLFQTVQTGRASSSEEDPTSIYANYLFLGNHFHSIPEIRFSSLSVNFTYFEEWMGHATFYSRSTTGDKVVADYSPPKEEAPVQKIDSLVTVHSDLVSTGDLLRSLEWIHTGLLTIRPTEPKDFAWYLKVLDSLQKFMTLLVGKPVHPKLVSAWTDTIEPHEVSHSLNKTSRVELFFHQEFRTPTPPRRSAHQSHITEDILVPLT